MTSGAVPRPPWGRVYKRGGEEVSTRKDEVAVGITRSSRRVGGGNLPRRQSPRPVEGRRPGTGRRPL